MLSGVDGLWYGRPVRVVLPTDVGRVRPAGQMQAGADDRYTATRTGY